ncbi:MULTISPECIES: Arc family DNA-binding protein [Giesbergeria]|uniref:Arc family DNA-binding protein n=1 Tax=Giesbergeria sinuosa TaxID=80883 RepID=A0ABV9QCG5_9BURK
MSREDPQLKIRLPADMKDRIEEAAKQAGRSMNAEIVARLEQTFQTGTPGAIDVGWLATELAQRLSGNGLQLAVIDAASSSPLSSDVRTTAVPLSKAEQSPIEEPHKT